MKTLSKKKELQVILSLLLLFIGFCSYCFVCLGLGGGTDDTLIAYLCS